MWILGFIIVISSILIILNKKGILDNEEFSVAVVIFLFGVAGYLGVSQY